MIVCRGVRGATTADANEREAILTATRELLALMIRLNQMKAEDVASIFFTVTSDIDAEFPAFAARQLGWTEVALMCARELEVKTGVPLCIRVLIHWNTSVEQKQIQHVYLKEARKLRPDKSILPPVDWQELENWIREQVDFWEKNRNRS